MEEQIERRSDIIAKNLYNAAIEGDVPSLVNLLQEDPFILDRCSIEKSGCFMQSPLHVAVNLGHLGFAREILGRKPELAEELDQLKGWSPLHMAAAKGHLEIVQILLAVNAYMCLSGDQEGRNPVHVAATRGQVHVLDEIFRVMPQAARERTNHGETVLHLCVKHNQPDALMLLVNVLDDGEILNSRNRDGNTILHLAVGAKQIQIIKFLSTNRKMEINAINSYGLTAMDTFIQSRKDIIDKEIWQALRRTGAQTANDALKPRNKERIRLDSQRNGLLVVASLIATMAFTIGISPPGGAWQDNNGHIAGTAVMADAKSGENNNRVLFFLNKVGVRQFDLLLIFNTIGLVSSLSVILLLISGLPCQRLFVAMLMMTMWIAVTATTLTYSIAVNFLASAKPDQAVWPAIEISLGVWLVLMILLLLGHAMRFFLWLTSKLVAREKVWHRPAN